MRSRILLLVAAVVVIPACGANKKLAAPQLSDWIPSPLANTGIAVMPNIVLQFDRPMDDAFVSVASNYALIPGAATTGIPITVQHLPALNQVRIIPGSLLQTNTVYTVLVAGVVESSFGTPMGNTTGFQFTTATSTTTTSILSWGGLNVAPAQGVNPGEVVLDLKDVQESSGSNPLANVAATYNVYASTTDGGEDLLAGTSIVAPASGVQTITLPQSNTLYFLKIQPVDSGGSVFTTLSQVSVTSK